MGYLPGAHKIGGNAQQLMSAVALELLLVGGGGGGDDDDVFVASRLELSG